MVRREIRVCAVSAIMASASSASVQVDRPSGGVEHAVAVNKASSVAVNFRAPAETDLQTYFGVKPPTAHRMIVTLTDRGLIRRRPGGARSIELLVSPDDLPPLR